MVTSPGVILRLSTGLAVLYGLVVIVWYELLRSMVLHRLRRRRGNEGRATTPHQEMREGARSLQNGRAAAAQTAPEESELDRARRHYYLARQAAKAERDAAIEAASGAAEEAIQRIERRYSEIDGAFIEEETERISQVLGRPSGGNGGRRD